MLRLGIIIGTRPEAIKLAPLIREAEKRGHRPFVLFTGQHEDLAKTFFKDFQIKICLRLKVMRAGQTQAALTSRILNSLDQNRNRILKNCDLLVVQGDTTSAFAGAYWGFLNHLPVAHVEAGLRTGNKHSPFPEEVNRSLIGRLSDFHFAPTPQAKRNLLAENIPAKQVYLVGNTAIDTLHTTLALLPKLSKEKRNQLPSLPQNKKLILVTAHRRESFGREFTNICKGILKILKDDPNTYVVYPVHPNPNVRAPVQKLLGNHPRIRLLNPLPYIPFVALMKKATLLLTDSGGIQEEGPTLQKPIIVMRNTTERPEGVKAGFSFLVGTNPDKIARVSLQKLNQGLSTKKKNPYGDGRSSQRIIKILERYF